MSDQFSTGGKNKRPDQDVSLSDLLPGLLADSPPPVSPGQTSYRPVTVQPPSEEESLPERRGGLGEVKIIIFAALGLILFPLIVVGIVLLLVNNQAGPTPEQLAQSATTPLPTVFSITPPSSGKAGSVATPARTIPNSSPVPTLLPLTVIAPLPACGPGAAFAGIDGYSCVRTMASTANWDSFFSLAEPQLNQNGIRVVGNQHRYDVTKDDPGRVLGFYSASLLGKGYNLTRPVSSGSTAIGNYRVDQYAKGSQQLQILALTLNRDSPDNTARSGETVIRYSAS